MAEEDVDTGRRPGVGRAIGVVVLAVTACVALVVLVDPGAGLGALALLLTAGGLARLMLPQRWLPGLAVRSRVLDGATSLALAALLVVLAVAAPSL